MRASEFILLEGSGLRAGKPGEVYTSPDGVEYKFQGWHWEFPMGAELAYATPEELQAGIDEVSGGDDTKIKWVNQAGRSKSFAYAEFKTDNGEELLIGKFFQKKSPNNTILDKEVKAVAGLSAGGSGAVKAEAALQPGQLGIADNRARTVQSLIKAVGAHEQGPMLQEALSAAAHNAPVVFAGGASIASALQDDFCEVIAPVAMIGGHPSVTGQLDQAVLDVFKGADIRKATISFPAEQNNPLVDSYIIKDGVTLGVSHKGKTGAKATITNIWKAKDEAAQTATGAAYIKKFKEAVAILDICKEQSGLTQPITLAQRYGIINPKEAQVLQAMIENARDPKYRLVGDPKNPNAVVREPTPDDFAKVPPSMRRIFKMGGYKSGSYVSFLCLARVAKLVADHINTDPKINFGEAIRSFLNSSAMVQAKSAVAPKGTDAVLRGINIVYPPNFQEKAKIESNGYSGTQVKGKFSFSLPTT